MTEGLSLVELLVVVAIILILAAIVSVAVSGVKRKTLETVCASNLAQIGKAFKLYADDYDDRLPPYSGESSASQLVGIDAEPGKLKQALMPYAKKDDVFYCPADRHARTATDHGHGDNSLHSSYMQSLHFSSGKPEVDKFVNVEWSRCPAPSAFRLFSDKYFGEEPNRQPPHEGRQCSVFFDLHTECYDEAHYYRVILPSVNEALNEPR